MRFMKLALVAAVFAAVAAGPPAMADQGYMEMMNDFTGLVDHTGFLPGAPAAVNDQEVMPFGDSRVVGDTTGDFQLRATQPAEQNPGMIETRASPAFGSAVGKFYNLRVMDAGVTANYMRVLKLG